MPSISLEFLYKSLCKAIVKQPGATCLLLYGAGPLGPGEFYSKNVTSALVDDGVKVVVINIHKGSSIPEQVALVLSEVDRFTSCIALGWGSGGTDIEMESNHS